MLNLFNQSLLQVSCHELFLQNPASFDGTSLIAKFADIHALLLAISNGFVVHGEHSVQVQPSLQNQQQIVDYRPMLMQGMKEGLYKYNQNIDNETMNRAVEQAFAICTTFQTKINNNSDKELHSGYTTLVKEVQQGTLLNK